MEVIISPEVQIYLNDLPQVLYRGNYFSYMETADAYVGTLVAEITRFLPLYPPRKAPPEYSRYGKDLRYVLIRRSKRTQWYIFFNMYRIGGELVYIVRHIDNNHIVSKHLRPSPV
jgi:hypothetical protein